MDYEKRMVTLNKTWNIRNDKIKELKKKKNRNSTQNLQLQKWVDLNRENRKSFNKLMKKIES